MLKFALCFAISAATFSVAATAQDRITVDGSDSFRVSYADLNLGSVEGRMTLDGRIRRAARKLCLDRGVADLKRAMIGRACVAEAISSTQPQIQLAVNDKSKSGDKRVVVSLRR